MDDQEICRPLRDNEPRGKLPDGTTVKRCSLYGSWGDPFRAHRPTKAGTHTEVVNQNGEGGHVADGNPNETDDAASPNPTQIEEGAMGRLHVAGLI